MPESIWTAEDIEALKNAIRRGVRRVRYAQQEVEYHSMDEMKDLLSTMRQSVAAAAGGSSFSLLTPHKGYDR